MDAEITYRTAFVEQCSPGSEDWYHSHGSPEGVVAAQEGATCVDVDSGILYYKTSGGYGTTGWSS